MLAGIALVFLGVLLAFLSLLTSAGFGYLIRAFNERLPVDASATGGPLDSLEPTREFAYGCGLGAPWPNWGESSVFGNGELHLQIVCQTPLPIVVAVMVVLAAILTLASALINLNKFSLHAAYRIRIVRTFLGASRGDDREPNPFTGFDPLDNLQMHELQPGLLRENDLLNPVRFAQKLRQALLRENGSDSAETARVLVLLMCESPHDTSRVLESRLRNAEPGKPLLKSLQRDLFEALNRVLETVRLDRSEPFLAFTESEAGVKYREALRGHLMHGNIIFANRLLLEAVFPGEIKPYNFPSPPPHKLVHLVNPTLNLVHGKRLAWQERKAAPFTVTPMHSGSYYLGSLLSKITLERN